MAGRYWGIWTKGKLQILERYLQQFVTATKNKSEERVYLDLFAGRPENRERLTKEELLGSARIALETENPPFTRLAFFEIGSRVAELDAALRSRYADRHFKVYEDANTNLEEALADLPATPWAPTFAFIDPDGPDCHWTTLETLARHKQGSRFKVEMWLLFPAALFTRQLPVNGRTVTDKDAEQITRMYGTDEWHRIYRARLDNEIDPGDAREEYVNLMRWRLERELRYAVTHPLEIFNERGGPLYHMIFATDNQAGDRIMRSLYDKALNEHPEMRNQARRTRERLAREAAGHHDLFTAGGLELPATSRERERALTYAHQPPWPPLGTGGN